MTARVRLVRRVVLHVGTSGALDADAARRAADAARAGDDVRIIVRGRLGFEPAVAALLGRSLGDCRTIEVEAVGPGADAFAADLAVAATTAVPVS